MGFLTYCKVDGIKKWILEEQIEFMNYCEMRFKNIIIQCPKSSDNICCHETSALLVFERLCSTDKRSLLFYTKKLFGGDNFWSTTCFNQAQCFLLVAVFIYLLSCLFKAMNVKISFCRGERKNFENLTCSPYLAFLEKLLFSHC